MMLAEIVYSCCRYDWNNGCSIVIVMDRVPCIICLRLMFRYGLDIVIVVVVTLLLACL